MSFLSAAGAARLARRARELARDRVITPHQFLLFDTLLWACRSAGRDECLASFTELQARTGMARQTVANGIARLAEVGLLARERRRVLVRWALGIASRQATNLYRFQAAPAGAHGSRTESATRTVHRGSVKKLPAGGGAERRVPTADEAETALEALRRLGRRLEAASGPPPAGAGRP